MTNMKYDRAIEKATPFMQGLYRALRSEGFNKTEAKNILEIALKHAMNNEALEGVDKREV